MNNDDSDSFRQADPVSLSLELTQQNKSSQIAAHLERLIINGALAPGDRLPAERSLASIFHVSRATVRGALSELESKHLVERVQGRGTTVLDPMTAVSALSTLLESSNTELRNATELRESVEPHIAALAAKRARPMHINALQEIVGKEEASDLTPEQSVKLDVRFHLFVAQATGNRLLLTVLQFVFKCTEQTREKSHQTPTGRRISHLGHQLILEAIKARNMAAAEHAMVQHLCDVHDVSTLA